MPSNNSKKIFEGLISRTKVYLILIAILLGIICIFNVQYIIPSIIVYVSNIYLLEQSKKKNRII